MFTEIMESECTFETGKKLVNLLNERGVISNYEKISSAFEDVDNLSVYIEQNCKQEFLKSLLSEGELEENLQFAEFMGIIFPNNSTAVDFEVFDNEVDEGFVKELIQYISNTTQGEWAVKNLNVELDEDEDDGEEILNISFESFGEKHEWELYPPLIDCLVEELQEFSSEYLKSGKLFIDHAAELIPIIYLPTDLVSELNEEFDTGGANDLDLDDEFIVFTGKMEQGTRVEMEDAAEEHGANIQKSINGKTTILVVGAKPGNSKLSKAKELGVRVISESEFNSAVE